MRAAAAVQGATAVDRPAPGDRGGWVEHRPFAIALLVATAVRGVVLAGFPPALVFSDGPTYLQFLNTFAPDPDRPAGYPLLALLPLSWLSSSVLAVAVAQHLLGLVSAGLLYVLLRRWGVGRWGATLAALPVLFDSLQLILEQSVLSDTLFELLLLIAVAVLGWRRRPRTPGALVAGVVLGSAVTVRVVGEPLLLVGIGYCLVVASGWRSRLTTALALCIGFSLPIAAYATWYHHERGVYALTELSGKALYMRVTPFVDCSRLGLPAYERVLCPPEPRGQRLDPSYYAWTDPRTVPRLRPPPGVTPDRAMRDFAVAAIRAQPDDYAAAVGRDFALNFDLWRADRFEYSLGYKWRFSYYPHFHPSDRTIAAYREFGGAQLDPQQPYAAALGGYQRVGYLPGPLLLGCLVLGLAGGLGVGRARASGLRSRCLLLTVSGVLLILLPAVTAAFSWRYQLPALALLPAGAALGYTALRGGTLATPSTD